MDLYDWLIFLHVLSAFLAVGSLTALWALVLSSSGAAPLISPDSAMRFGRTAGVVVGVGMMGAIFFGVWLAIDLDGYELWDPWILASIVIWAIAGWAEARLVRRSQATRWAPGRRASAIRRSTASGSSSSWCS